MQFIILVYISFIIIIDILYIFIDIGYCQGMNDILSRFLVISDSEVDSYWMFCYYMDKKRSDFLEDTMMSKIGGCGLILCNYT